MIIEELPSFKSLVDPNNGEAKRTNTLYWQNQQAPSDPSHHNLLNKCLSQGCQDQCTSE